MYLLDHTNNAGMQAAPIDIHCMATGHSPGSLIVVAQCVGSSGARLGKIEKESVVVTGMSEMSEMCGHTLEAIGESWKMGENVVQYLIGTLL